MTCSEVFLAILAIALFLMLIAVYKYQIFARFTVKELVVPGGTLLFSTYQGNYKNMVPFMKKIENQIISQLPPEEESRAKFFRIYYDDPHKVADANKCRALVGAILDQKGSDVNSAPKFDAKGFSKRFKSYSAVDFQDLTTFGVTFPLHNILSTVSAIYRGYPAIRKYGVLKDLMDSVRCSMEIYDYPAKELTICLPYGSSADFILYLSGLPAPASRADEEVKKRE